MTVYTQLILQRVSQHKASYNGVKLVCTALLYMHEYSVHSKKAKMCVGDGMQGVSYSCSACATAVCLDCEDTWRGLEVGMAIEPLNKQ